MVILEGQATFQYGCQIQCPNQYLFHKIKILMHVVSNREEEWMTITGCHIIRIETMGR